MGTETGPDHETIPFDPSRRDLGVVVGFDGSPNAETALQWAAGQAARRDAPLTVISAYRAAFPIYSTYAALPTEPENEVKKHQAESLLEGAGKQLEAHTGPVTFLTVEGDSVGALIDVSARSQLMVVGARGRGGFLGRILGSVADALPAHAQCPTVVVPAAQQSAEIDPTAAPGADGLVVVGVDGSSHGRRALLHAAQEAAVLETSLQVVMALPPPDSGEFWYPVLSRDVTELIDTRRAELGTELEAEVAWLSGHVPDVPVSSEVRVGPPAGVLAEATRGARLTVLGTRGRGAFSSALIGSVSRAVLHGAEGPVMVVPALHDERL